MIIGAIIAEFNPFHLGHKYLIDKAREEFGCDYVIAIMSGNFVQRGEPAIFDKYYRAKSAILNGIDLVIELPICYATSSAGDFAEGAVKIINQLGFIDYLIFGSEIDDLSKIQQLANLTLDDEMLFDNIKPLLKNGLSFPKAREIYLSNKTDFCIDFINNSNVILAVEYIKALKKSHSKIEPKLVKRIVSSYNDTKLTGNISSATSIRKAILDNKDISSIIPYDIDKNPIIYEDFFSEIAYLIRFTPKNKLVKLSRLNDKNINRLITASFKANNLYELINSTSHKALNITSVQRALLKILFNGKDRYYSYINVLAGRKESLHLLRYCKSQIVTCNKNRTLKKDSTILLDNMYLLKKSQKYIFDFKDIRSYTIEVIS